MATAQELIIGGLRELGVGAAGEPVDGEYLFYGLTVFNDLIDAMKANRLSVFELRRRTFNLIANTASYAIGPNATWDMDSGRPEVIVRAGFSNTVASADDPIETKVRVYTDEEWAAIGLKTLTSTIVWGLWYQTGVADGTVYPYPIPSASVTAGMVLYLPEPLAEVAEDDDGLATEVVVPPGYRRMFRTNLALEMADYFGIEPSGNLLKRANNSMRAVQKANIKPALLRLPRGLINRKRGRFNLLSNQ